MGTVSELCVSSLQAFFCPSEQPSAATGECSRLPTCLLFCFFVKLFIGFFFVHSSFCSNTIFYLKPYCQDTFIEIEYILNLNSKKKKIPRLRLCHLCLMLTPAYFFIKQKQLKHVFYCVRYRYFADGPFSTNTIYTLFCCT